MKRGKAQPEPEPVATAVALTDASLLIRPCPLPASQAPQSGLSIDR
jgi:hypothetical protein